METFLCARVSSLHLEADTYHHLLQIAESRPGYPTGCRYDPNDPWHQLIVESLLDGCMVHTDVVEFIHTDPVRRLPESLLTILRDACRSNATWVVFDNDLLPMSDYPIHEHPDEFHVADEAT